MFLPDSSDWQPPRLVYRSGWNFQQLRVIPECLSLLEVDSVLDMVARVFSGVIIVEAIPVGSGETGSRRESGWKRRARGGFLAANSCCA